MTEISDTKVELPAAIERFVLHWGDMGDEWGVNRSVSQIHGLLYLAEMPMTAEDIAETLGMARSNVSNSIKELLSWNLIRRVHRERVVQGKGGSSGGPALPGRSRPHVSPPPSGGLTSAAPPR